MLAYKFWKEIWIFKSDWYNFHSIWPAEEFMGRLVTSTVKPVYNDHLMGYFSAFWSYLDELQKAEIVSKSELVPSVFIKTHNGINHR